MTWLRQDPYTTILGPTSSGQQHHTTEPNPNDQPTCELNRELLFKATADVRGGDTIFLAVICIDLLLLPFQTEVPSALPKLSPLQPQAYYICSF